MPREKGPAVWWLSLNGKLSLPFNEPDALILGAGGLLAAGECSPRQSGGDLAPIASIALEPRALLLAAAGFYESSGSKAADLAELSAWIGAAGRLQQASFMPIRRRRRRLLRAVQQRRESYLRHLRRRSDAVEVGRQLRRLLRDCGQYPGKWRAGRLLHRWCSWQLLEQLAQLEVSELLHPVFWPSDSSQQRPAESVPSADPEHCSSACSDSLGNHRPEAGWVDGQPLGVEAQRSAAAVAELAGGTASGAPAPAESFRSAFERMLQAEKLAALRQLAYGASHEINNPLANIAMRAELLLRGEADQERQRKLQVIRQQALRAHELISDLMLFANPPRPNLQELELEPYLHRLATELRAEVELAGGTLRLELGSAGRVVVDPGQLAEVVRVLVRNAVEAQPRGALIVVRGEVTPERETRIEVRDNGPGIEAEVARHMFDPFFSSREAGRGLGFGLAKAWRIAESHGGRLECVNLSPGETRFRFEWPRLEQPVRVA